MENIIGRKLVNNKNEEIDADEALDTSLKALFFTASWCSPCEIFARELVEIYNETNQGEKVFEIIQISFEKSEDIYKKSIITKPWIFIPYNDPKNQEICDYFNVLTVPMFFVLNKDGSILTDTGRKEISDEGVKAVDKWLKTINS